MSECKCTMAQKLVGDGCDECNPELALEHANDRIAELEQDNGRLLEVLGHIREYWNQDQNETAMADALWHIIDTCDEALAKHAEIAG